jgi:hypothetical protein
MALIIKDRVQETSTTEGTIPMVFGGAPTNFVAFDTVMDTGDTTYYAIISATDWEVGLGTYTSGTNSLARTVVYASSNGGSVVNFAAGTKFVYIDAAADRVVMEAADGSIASPVFSGSISGTPSVASGSSLSTQIVSVDLGSLPVYSYKYSVAISATLWNAATFVTASGYGADFALISGGVTAYGDEYEMDGLTVTAQKGVSPNITLYINSNPGPVAGLRNIALQLF